MFKNLPKPGYCIYSPESQNILFNGRQKVILSTGRNYIVWDEFRITTTNTPPDKHYSFVNLENYMTFFQKDLNGEEKFPEEGACKTLDKDLFNKLGATRERVGSLTLKDCGYAWNKDCFWSFEHLTAKCIYPWEYLRKIIYSENKLGTQNIAYGICTVDTIKELETVSFEHNFITNNNNLKTLQCQNLQKKLRRI